MSTPGDGPLWKHILREAVLGNRGLVKAGMLLLPWTVVVIGGDGYRESEILSTFFLIFLTVASWLMTCILANDISDSRDDRAAGKQRWINRLPRTARILITAFFLGLGPGILLLSKAPAGTWPAYCGAVVLGLSYSLKPLRLKGAGIRGILAYSMSCAVAYVFIPWTWLSSRWELLLVLAPAVFLDKWVSIHFHQVMDFEADHAQNIKTYAVLVGAERARRNLRRLARLASLWLVIVLVVAAFLQPLRWGAAALAITGAVVLLGGLWIRMTYKSPAKTPSLVRELPWYYSASAYAVFRILPLILIFRLSLEAPSLWAVEGTAAILVAAESLFLYGEIRFFRRRDQ